VLTPAKAATYLNIKPATLKSWRAKGVGPAFVKRAARLIGYTPAALDACLTLTGETCNSSTNENDWKR
jgi:hypothetical protein